MLLELHQSLFVLTDLVVTELSLSQILPGRAWPVSASGHLEAFAYAVVNLRSGLESVLSESASLELHSEHSPDAEIEIVRALVAVETILYWVKSLSCHW